MVRGIMHGKRRARRHKSVKVQYRNEKFQTRFRAFTGWTAQIILHGAGRCGGILI